MRAAAFCLLVLCLGSTLKAQDYPKTVLKLNVFGFFGSQAQPYYDRVTNNPINGFFANQYQLVAERAISKRKSLQLSAGYIGVKSSQQYGNNRYSGKLAGYIFIPEYRYFLTRKPAPARLYAAAFLRYRYTLNKLTDESPDLNSGGVNVSRRETSQAVGGGLLIGYQFLIGKKKHFALDIFFGPQYKDRSSHIDYNYPEGNDAEFAGKFISVRVVDRSGFGARFGINMGYAF